MSQVIPDSPPKIPACEHFKGVASPRSEGPSTMEIREVRTKIRTEMPVGICFGDKKFTFRVSHLHVHTRAGYMLPRNGIRDLPFEEGSPGPLG